MHVPRLPPRRSTPTRHAGRCPRADARTDEAPAARPAPGVRPARLRVRRGDPTTGARPTGCATSAARRGCRSRRRVPPRRSRTSARRRRSARLGVRSVDRRRVAAPSVPSTQRCGAPPQAPCELRAGRRRGQAADGASPARRRCGSRLPAGSLGPQRDRRGLRGDRPGPVRRRARPGLGAAVTRNRQGGGRLRRAGAGGRGGRDGARLAGRRARSWAGVGASARGHRGGQRARRPSARTPRRVSSPSWTRCCPSRRARPWSACGR